MNTKLNVQELFFQLKNKKPNRSRSFDRGLYALGIHQSIKHAAVAGCVDKNEVNSGLEVRD